MGSVINVSIPTRVYEIQLRLKQGQVVLYKTIDKKLMGPDDAEDEEAEPEVPLVVPLPLTGDLTAKKVSKASVDSVAAKTSEGEVLPEMNLENITVPAAGKTKDHYIGLSGGRPAEIFITHDTMEIILKEKTSKEKLILEKKDSTLIADEIIRNTFQEKHMEETLTKFTLNHASWRPSIDGNFSIISFSVNTDRSDKVINHIRMLGIGTKYKSKLSVISAVAYLDSGEAKMRELQEAKTEEKPKDDLEETEEKKETNWGKFVSSIRARLTVAQVIQTVESGATITFDFVILILIAGTIAALGLLENSSVNLVASMLISPLMGPILAQTFGLVIRDYRLARIGLISESTGLNICLCIGFIFGLLISCKAYKGPWYGIKIWPTPEMQARGQLRGIIVGAMIAAPSGAGVALSILGGNAGSLVGVAISASLLPPAVNSGLFCGLALMVYAQEASAGRSVGGCHEYLGSSSDSNNTLAKKEDYIRAYEMTYCENIVHDFALMGVCSFGLTLVNIILIIATSYIVLKIKEVAPHTTKKSMRRFWKEDLAIMRAYNKAHKNHYKKQVLLDDIKNADNPEAILEEVQKDKVFDSVNRRTVFQASNILDDVLKEENKPPEGPQPELVFKKTDEKSIKSKAKSKGPSKRRPPVKPLKNVDV